MFCLSPLPWSWGKPKKQQKYNNIATTHLHSCTPKRGSYARAQVTSHYCLYLTYHKRIWKDSNVLDGPFGSRTLHLSHQQYPMYLWMLIHNYRILAFINIRDDAHLHNCSNRQLTTNLAEEDTSVSTFLLTSSIAVLLDLHKPPRDPTLQPSKISKKIDT